MQSKRTRREPELSITLGPLDVAALSNQARLGNGCVCAEGCESCDALAEAFEAMREALHPFVELNRQTVSNAQHNAMYQAARAALKLADKVRS